MEETQELLQNRGGCMFTCDWVSRSTNHDAGITCVKTSREGRCALEREEKRVTSISNMSFQRIIALVMQKW